MRNIRNLTYFHLFRKKIKDVSHISLSLISDCWQSDNHYIVTTKPKWKGKKRSDTPSFYELGLYLAQMELTFWQEIRKQFQKDSRNSSFMGV